MSKVRITNHGPSTVWIRDGSHFFELPPGKSAIVDNRATVQARDEAGSKVTSEEVR